MCHESGRTGNKLGNQAPALHGAAARAYPILVAGTSPTNPDLRVYSGRELLRSQAPGSAETVSANLPAGDSVLVINVGGWQRQHMFQRHHQLRHTP